MPSSTTKTSLILGLAALASASPLAKRQNLNLGAIVDQQPAPTVTIATVATTIIIDPTSLASAAAAQMTANPITPDVADVLAKRDSLSGCAARPAQPTGAGPVPSPDTASAFLAYNYFSSVAMAAPTPTGYTLAFENLQAEINGYGYLGYTTLSSYDTQACANQCNTIYGCQAINIAFERDPSVDPDYYTCTNPPSTTEIRCIFYGAPVTAQTATNDGQWRADFHVVVAGSNGYTTNANNPAVAGYTGPDILANAAINAPLDCNGHDTYMGFVAWNDGVAFDAARCAAACSAQSQYNVAHPPSNGAPMTCQYFNTYLLLKNGAVQDQVCVMYNQTWSDTYAVNTGYTWGSDVYTIASSLTYSNTTMPGSCVAN